MTILQSARDAQRFIDTSRGANDFVNLAIYVARSVREQMPLSAFAKMARSPRLKELLANPALPMMLKGAPTGTSDMGITDATGMSNAMIQSIVPFSNFERALADGSFLTVPLRAFV